MLNQSSRVWAPWFGMGCKAQTTVIAPLWRGFATLQTAQNRDDRAARDLFSVALARVRRMSPLPGGHHLDGVTALKSAPRPAKADRPPPAGVEQSGKATFA